MRHAHSLESLEMIGWDIDRGGVHSQDTDHLLTHPIRGREGAGLVLRSGPPSPTHKEAISIRLLDSKGPIEALGFDSTPPPPSPRPRSIPPPLRLDVDAAGRSVLRLVSLSAQLPPCWTVPPSSDPHSDSSSLQSGPNHVQPAGGRQVASVVCADGGFILFLIT
ncbi:hypothetical protein L3Q82_016348, partial [Scortum barcoo]